jgi:3'(2'), 5'-bisphosphate nucleotidase
MNWPYPTILPLVDIAVSAGAAIQQFAAKACAVDIKSDDSPVTEADRAAESIICAALSRLWPDIPIVAEEQMSQGQAVDPKGGRFFLVDPLDGTKEFIAGRPDYTVNIALIEHGIPSLGVVYAPARRVVYFGSPEGACLADVMADEAMADIRPVAVRTRPERPTVVGSLSHPSAEADVYTRSLGDCDTVSIGSSLKFCLIAAGEADLYPRFGRTMQWDTAAGQAVLVAAGGSVRDLSGLMLAYGKQDAAGSDDFANPAFIASGKM